MEGVSDGQTDVQMSVDIQEHDQPALQEVSTPSQE